MPNKYPLYKVYMGVDVKGAPSMPKGFSHQFPYDFSGEKLGSNASMASFSSHELSDPSAQGNHRYLGLGMVSYGTTLMVRKSGEHHLGWY